MAQIDRFPIPAEGGHIYEGTINNPCTDISKQIGFRGTIGDNFSIAINHKTASITVGVGLLQNRRNCRFGYI